MVVVVVVVVVVVAAVAAAAAEAVAGGQEALFCRGYCAFSAPSAQNFQVSAEIGRLVLLLC